MFRSVWRITSKLSTKRRLASPTTKLKTEENERQKTRSRLTFIGIALGCIGGSWATAEHRAIGEDQERKPSRSSYKYLICGGGVAAQEALKVFINENESHDLLLISPEWTSYRHQPANSQIKEDPPGMQSWVVDWVCSLIPSSFSHLFLVHSPEVVIGRSVKTVDAARRVAILDDGTQVAFERCLIAAGSSVPSIPIGKVVSRDAAGLVSGAQSSSDWNRIDSIIRSGFEQPSESQAARAHLTVVGGGWMSTVVGAELVDRGADVTFSHAEPAFLARYLPKYLAQEILARLLWASDGGVDSLSYAALRYINTRESLEQNSQSYEAEVHVGTVFDSFSIVDFRTDHVIFAPTLCTRVPVEVPSAMIQDGGYVVNPELAVASDVYAAGSSVTVGSGALDYPKVMRWSADNARATGRHAAYNVLGAREPYTYRPSLTVDLDPLRLQLHVIGDIDGSCESFGYFIRGKNCEESTCGGQLEVGVLFCVRPAPISHRGASQKLLITGLALWDGSKVSQIPDIEAASEAGRNLLKKNAMNRPELEAAMDSFASECIGISLFQNSSTLDRSSPVSDITKIDTEQRLKGDEDNERDEHVQKPLVDLRKPSPRVIWRRHRPARTVPVRPDELLWVQDEWEGAVSSDTREDKVSRAYTELLRGAAAQT